MTHISFVVVLVTASAGVDPGAAPGVREAVALRTTASSPTAQAWVPIVQEEVRRELAAARVVELTESPEAAAHGLDVALGDAAAVELQCPREPSIPAPKLCTPFAWYVKVTVNAKASLVPRASGEHATELLSRKVDGFALEELPPDVRSPSRPVPGLAAPEGEAPEAAARSAAGRAAVRAAGQDIGREIVSRLLRIPGLEPEVAAGPVDGDRVALERPPAHWWVGQRLEVVDGSGAGSQRRVVGHARLRRAASGEPYAQVIEPPSASDRLLVRSYSANRFDLSVGMVAEVPPGRFPYADSGARLLPGLAVEAGAVVAAVLGTELHVSLYVDALRLGAVRDLDFVLVHPMAGITAKWQFGRTQLTGTVRAGAALYAGSVSSAESYSSGGGDVLIGLEQWLGPWPSVFLAVGARYFPGPFPTLTSFQPEGTATKRSARDELGAILLLGARVMP